MPSPITRRPAPPPWSLLPAVLGGVLATGLFAQAQETESPPVDPAPSWQQLADWTSSLPEARRRAKAEKKLILAYIHRSDADCPVCDHVERRVLGARGFVRFAENVVLFRHARTAASTGESDELLRAKRGTAYPHLVFLDEKGAVLDVPREHTVRNLAETWQALSILRRLQPAKDDARAQSAVLLAKVRLRRLSVAEAVSKRSELQMTKVQDARFREAIADLEIETVLAEARRTRDFAGVGPRFAAMLEAGRIPAASNNANRFWSQLMAHAQDKRDAKLYARSYGAYRELLGDDPRHARQFARFDAILEALKNGDEIPKPTARR